MKHKFFTTSPLKFALLSIFTLTLFNVYWFYKNLLVFKKNNPKKGSWFPLIEAIFSPLFSYRCFRDIKKTAQEAGINSKISPSLMAFVYFLFFAIGVSEANENLILINFFKFFFITY